MNTTPETTYNREPVVFPAVSAPGITTGALAWGPDNPPWGPGLAFLTWIASIILLLLPQVLALPYIAIRYQGLQPTPEVLLADKTVIIILVAGILPAHIITLFIAWSVITRWGKFSAKKMLGWDWNGGVNFRRSVGLAVLLFGVVWLTTLVLGGKETPLERILSSSRAAALIVAFLAVATAPLVEEVVYRGVVYPVVQRMLGWKIAVVIVTLMFAVPHVPQYWPNVAVISSITLLSVLLTLIRARTGRLLPCFMVHLVFNGIQSLIIILEPYLRAMFEMWRHEPANGTLVHLFRFLV